MYTLFSQKLFYYIIKPRLYVQNLLIQKSLKDLNPFLYICVFLSEFDFIKRAIIIKFHIFLISKFPNHRFSKQKYKIESELCRRRLLRHSLNVMVKCSYRKFCRIGIVITFDVPVILLKENLSKVIQQMGIDQISVDDFRRTFTFSRFYFNVSLI